MKQLPSRCLFTHDQRQVACFAASINKSFLIHINILSVGHVFRPYICKPLRDMNEERFPAICTGNLQDERQEEQHKFMCRKPCK